MASTTAGQVCRVPSRSHTWRFHRSGCGCHMVPSPRERRSFLRGMQQGGAVARKISSGNQVRVGQSGATSWTWSSSSLNLHSVCASRLTGETNTCVNPEASCVPVGGLVGSKQVHLSFPESTPNQPVHLGMESPFSGERKLS